jgi:hypothetical protein
VPFFIDTVAAGFVLENENDNSEAAQAIARMQRISAETGALVVPLHHYGKTPTTGLRGASAWKAGADGALAVLCHVDEMTWRVTGRELALEKSRTAATGPIAPFELCVETVGVDEDGDDIIECWIRPLLDQPPRVAATAKRKREPNVLVAFRQAFAEIPTFVFWT